MSRVTVLLCSRVRVDADAQPGVAAVVVQDLCERPRAAAAALRAALQGSGPYDGELAAMEALGQGDAALEAAEQEVVHAR